MQATGTATPSAASLRSMFAERLRYSSPICKYYASLCSLWFRCAYRLHHIFSRLLPATAARHSPPFASACAASTCGQNRAAPLLCRLTKTRRKKVTPFGTIAGKDTKKVEIVQRVKGLMSWRGKAVFSSSSLLAVAGVCARL